MVKSVFVVVRYDYDGDTMYAAFTSRDAADAFIAAGITLDNDELTAVELPLNPPHAGAFCAEVDVEARTVKDSGWWRGRQPGDVESVDYATYRTLVFSESAEEAKTKALLLLDAASPYVYKFYDRANEMDLRTGCPWVLDQSDRVWTHSRQDIIDRAVKGTRIYGSSPFDFLYQQKADDRSGWILLAENVAELNGSHGVIAL